ncbi:MAG: redoxin domain-containing protein [Phycisphaerae bacterium]
MARVIISNRVALALGVVCCGWLAAPRAWGQSKATLRELRKLHERLADPDRVLTARQAKQAADRLAEWRLAPEKLPPADRARLWRIQVCIGLAKGAARMALEPAQALQAEFPDEPAALEAAYLAACAAGDAKLGTDTLKKLSRSANREQRRRLSQRRRWIRGVGQKAPDVLIRTEDMTEFSTTRRGDRVLLIDFWNVLLPPDEKEVRALRDLYEEYRHSLHVEFVGVNADAEARVDEARKFAQENGFVWKQRYEYQARQAPITHEAFHAGKPPWQVLIDTFGYVRAIGAASEPGFQYALRAAIAETRGDQEIVMPRTHDGKQPTRPSALVEPKAKESKPPAGELPSNPEALAKLRLARTYLKTGKRTDAKRLFEEIVRQYPGTPEAKEAQEYLDSIWNP